MVDNIASTLDKKMNSYVIFLDKVQAFDRVWRVGLLLKLTEVFPLIYYQVLKSILTDFV